jgi:hypothetical protein
VVEQKKPKRIINTKIFPMAALSHTMQAIGRVDDGTGVIDRDPAAADPLGSSFANPDPLIRLIFEVETLVAVE